MGTREMSAEIPALACGLILAGLAAENVLARRWVREDDPLRFGPMAVLALALPALGLTVLAILPS